MEERSPRRASVPVLSGKRGWYSLLRGRIHVWIIFFLVIACPAAAQEAGRVVSILGAVEVLRGGQWQPVKLGEVLSPREVVRTEAGSQVAIQLLDKSQLKVNANSQLELKQVAPTVRKVGMEVLQTLLRLLSGEVWVRSYVEPFKIETMAVTATIRGTELNLAIEPAEATRLTVVEGVVEFRNPQGSVFVAAKEQAIAKPGEAPRKVVIINPRDAVQWALYYPPLIDYRQVPYPVGPDAQAIRRALDHYRRGALPETLRSLEQVPPERRDARFFTLRAGLLLSVSQVAEARADIEEALRRNSSEATAHALRSIIALVQNQKEEALSLARKAAELEPQAPVPQVALSYAYQAAFDLENALDSLKQAVRLAPGDALIHARLAELELSRGELERALKAAQKAVALDPELARTHTVLGFAYLTQIRTVQAKAAFERAITLDSADPLPRLGLGLAKIRESNLTEGAREIEIAASLDPNSALIRSYLGKTYYEEKREGLAARELAIAKELDPKDPTSWFYDAIHKQTTNRPVEALHDLQKAIELNDNRAVYRSRLLLDEDVAARSVNLARIYDNLGFQQRARVEAWNSLTADPASFSAHRFLADSYSTAPRHEIARVSELLQSQLLQPTNITPLQPELAVSNLGILEGAGPSSLSFYELNPMFIRDGAALQANALFGNNDTVADDFVVSGIRGPFSGSLGQFHYETNGFRPNNDLEHNIYNAFGQVRLTSKLDVQVELRRREQEAGDIDITLAPVDLSFRQKIEQDSVRIGAHYKITPRQDLLASAIYADTETITDTISSDAKVNFRSPVDGYANELQHIYRGARFKTLAGIGYVKLDRRDIETDVPIVAGTEVFCSPKCEDSDRPESTNGYLYAPIALGEDAVVTLGASYDSFHTAVFDRHQLNPKFGVIWNITPSTTLRAAAFRVLKRFFVTNQTLEPTQLAGFNQFYDDLDGTDSTRYGVGLDQRFSRELFGGAEASWRQLTRIFSDRVGEDQDERFYRAYINWALHPNLALAAEYQFEGFRRSQVLVNETRIFRGDLPRLYTHYVPLHLSYYHRTGFFAKLGATYVHQEAPDSVFPETKQDFWVVDAGIGYRLPKRYGLVSLDAKNLFDEEFSYQNSFNRGAQQLPRFQPERAVFARINLWFY